MNVIQYIQSLIAHEQTKQAIEKLIEIAPAAYKQKEAIGISHSFYNFMQSAATMNANEQRRGQASLVERITNLLEFIEEDLQYTNHKILKETYEFTPPPLPSVFNNADANNQAGNEDQKRKILFLSANPAKTTMLKLPDEMRDIKDTLNASKNRDDFDFIIEPQINSSIMTRRIGEEEPEIVHFSGHGGLDAGFEEGIVVNNKEGKPGILTSDALSLLFELSKEHVKCVVLNACYSQSQAEAIRQHIPHVIGMSKAIKDTSAIAFSVGFYAGLGLGKSYPEAFKRGKLAIQMQELEGANIPILL